MKTVQQMRTIELLGTIDALTEIANRRFFDERLATEWERAICKEKTLSILSLDVDLFKQYNDTYGHLQGDVLLQTLVKVFPQHIRDEIDLAARIGGEEFAIILPDTELAEAVAVAEEIRQAVEVMEISSVGSMDTQITISIGVAARKPKIGDDLLEVLDEADKELYRAKNQGRNQVCSGLK
jgi:diguanylate cyclase (GGDEF)-like protein